MNVIILIQLQNLFKANDSEFDWILHVMSHADYLPLICPYFAK